MLFPGGTPQLQLTEPDDPETTGVEVVAQPRGKKLAKMSLMSGGEKSLTALALLFARLPHAPVPVLHPRRGRGGARRHQPAPLRRVRRQHARRTRSSSSSPTSAARWRWPTCSTASPCRPTACPRSSARSSTARGRRGERADEPRRGIGASPRGSRAAASSSAGSSTCCCGRGPDLDEEFWSDLEDALIGADMGVTATTEIVDALRDQAAAQGAARRRRRPRRTSPTQIAAEFPTSRARTSSRRRRSPCSSSASTAPARPRRSASSPSRRPTRAARVLLGSADTFRAAAVEQLDVWAERAGVPVVERDRGADPAAVAFDTRRARRARPAPTSRSSTPPAGCTPRRT